MPKLVKSKAAMPRRVESKTSAEFRRAFGELDNEQARAMNLCTYVHTFRCLLVPHSECGFDGHLLVAPAVPNTYSMSRNSASGP